MRQIDDTRMGPWFTFASMVLVLACGVATPSWAQPDNETCLMCHGDPDLAAANGQKVAVNGDGFAKSVHADLACTDCHTQDADYDDAPHFARYQHVDCSGCHDGAVASFHQNFHFKAREEGNRRAPECVNCHATAGDPHQLHALDKALAEGACRTCHTKETGLYDASVHAARPGASTSRPGCITCHQSHGPDYRRRRAQSATSASSATGTRWPTCARRPRAIGGRACGQEQGASTARPVTTSTAPTSHTCPPVSPKRARSVTRRNATFQGRSTRTCSPAARCTASPATAPTRTRRPSADYDGGCGSCHSDVEETYRSSVHRFGRLRGNEGAATCADCHKGHHVLPASDPAAPINAVNIPSTCGQCHGEQCVVAGNFVRLPITLSQYQQSVHGMADKTKINAATCTDCHGVHDLQQAQNPTSSVNIPICRHLQEVPRRDRGRVRGLDPRAGRCGRYRRRAHLHRLPRRASDPKSEAIRRRRRRRCRCPASCAGLPHRSGDGTKYGITAGVVSSYLDSYHGWAIDRGGALVATCVDCHTVHSIRVRRIRNRRSIRTTWPTPVASATNGQRDLRAVIHARQCAGARGPHELGEADLHRADRGRARRHGAAQLRGRARYELIKHRSQRRQEAYVVRWRRVERMQHLVLLTSFTGLAITGFALRMPDAWWVHVLGLAGTSRSGRTCTAPWR